MESLLAADEQVRSFLVASALEVVAGGCGKAGQVNGRAANDWGVGVAMLDLTAIGQNLSPEQCAAMTTP